jgi:16S rRNA (cytosine1402-N4)-methyltransferase
MLAEVLQVLAPQPGDTAVDCTLGFAGHARALLERVGATGRLVGLDWDQEHVPRARELLAQTGLPFTIHQGNFAGLPRVLAEAEVEAVDVLIADLGMSSMQVDDPKRGFSYTRAGPLDMRMDRSRGRTVAEVLLTISQGDLAQALRELGDEPDAERIASALVAARQASPLETTTDLARVIAEVTGRPVTRQAGWRLRPQPDKWILHPAARTFQALRILVNRELANLQELLRVLPTVLRPGGRAALITFHSGEDRLVKNSFRAGRHSGVFDQGSDDPIRAGAQERFANPRSRSAKLRWVRRTLA